MQAPAPSPQNAWKSQESIAIPRRRFVRDSALMLGAAAMVAREGWANPTEPPSFETVRRKTLDFIEARRVKGGPVGAYTYSASVARPTLYSSTYAAMTRHLYGDLESLSASERQEWIDYIQSHQDDDGLFRDPVIFDQGWYKGDPEWCGRRHLSCHVVTALTCLGGVARKPMRFLDPFLEPGGLVRWLETRNWKSSPDFVGNEVLNVGTLLQYARDFQGNKRCGPATEELLDWMRVNHMSAETGLWGGLPLDTPASHSRAVQAAYHLWLLYFYDQQPIPHPERAIDACLKTQNPTGGYGQGVHCPSDPLKSSACEDIDSIDPLARLVVSNDYRRSDVLKSLERGLKHLLTNQTEDGGFWFLHGQGFSYGHGELTSSAEQGGMFPTWFRTLTLAYLGKALPDSSVGAYPWVFSDCPGLQFWRS